jgi:hypothetical protein
VEEWCTPLFQGIAIDRFLVACSRLPAPKEHTNPFERQGPDSGLMWRSFVPLWLVVGAGPEGMPRGFRRPCDERLSQELGAL